ncbi:hypothetical protein [[Kitasatospora] papulosa]|uniref:hypothetical protein n=1 Tax=[Kitasatospora] papulosa TaxID=1464011 RepID=UPI003689A34A
MNAHDSDDDLLALLPKPTPRQMFDELQAARAAAEAAPPPEPSVIPMPDYPYALGHPLAGTVRFRCPLGCGWFHDENPGAEPLGPVLLPADLDRLNEALTAQATARHAAFRERVETAITGHYEQQHPGR